MDVCLLWLFVLPNKGLCDGPIPRPEEIYRLWCVNVCDLQTSSNEAALAHIGMLCQKTNKIKNAEDGITDRNM
jgi:hypothetical protein